MTERPSTAVGSHEKSPERRVPDAMRSGVCALTGIERVSVMGEGTEAERMKEVSALHAHAEWVKRTTPGLDKNLADIESRIVAVEPLLDAGNFEETETKAFSDILERLRKDPRTSSGGLPHVFSLVNPILKDRDRIDAYLSNPAYSTIPKRATALQAMRELCNVRLAMLQVDTQSLAVAEDRIRDQYEIDGMDRAKHSARILITAVAGFMALLSAFLAMKSKRSMVPAAIYGMVAFLAAGGIKIMSESPSDRQLKRLAFLGTDGFQTLSKTYGIKGKPGVEIAQAIYDNEQVVKDYLKKTRSGTVVPDEQEAFIAELGLSEAAAPIVRNMLQKPEDLRLLKTYLLSAKDDESKENIVAYIHAAPDPEDLKSYAADLTHALEVDAA